MSQINLIFHGMMLFEPDGDFINVLMPEIKEHEYKWGDPDDKTQPLKILPAGTYEIQGPLGGGAKFLDADKYLTLPAEVFSIAQDGLQRVKVRVPRPYSISYYRQVKPKPGAVIADVILNGMTYRGGKPTNPCAVVVFSYQSGNLGGMVTKPEPAYLNLCFYAETGFSSVGVMPITHRTGVNDLLHYSENSMIRHPKFELSCIGYVETATAPPLGTGMSINHMFSLYERDANLSDRSGCLGAALGG